MKRRILKLKKKSKDKKPRPHMPGDVLVSKTGVLFIPARDTVFRTGIALYFPPCALHPKCWMRGGQIHNDEVMYRDTRHATKPELKALRKLMRENDVPLRFEQVAVPPPKKKKVVL